MAGKTRGSKSGFSLVSGALAVVAIVAVTQGNYGGAVFAILFALVVAAFSRRRPERVK